MTAFRTARQAWYVMARQRSSRRELATQAWLGTSTIAVARLDPAQRGRHGKDRRRATCSAVVWLRRRGLAWRRQASTVPARQAWLGDVCHRGSRHGSATQAWPVTAPNDRRGISRQRRPRGAGRGWTRMLAAGHAWAGGAARFCVRLGPARLGTAGVAWCGFARRLWAWHDNAGLVCQGSACPGREWPVVAPQARLGVHRHGGERRA